MTETADCNICKKNFDCPFVTSSKGFCALYEPKKRENCDFVTYLHVEESYSWYNDIMKIHQKQIMEQDNARINEICNHYECDLSEFHEWLNQKRGLRQEAET